jgi:hypothetical protein
VGCNRKICEDAADGTSVKPSLRKILADSHVAAVAIAALLTFALQSFVDALWSPFVRVADFVLNAIAILGIPSGSWRFGFTDLNALTAALSYCLYAFISIVAAWLLSRWIYGMTPISMLRAYHARFARRANA